MAPEADSVVRVCSKSEVTPARRVRSATRRLRSTTSTGRSTSPTTNAPHAAASLADGMIEGDVIECCMHMGSFHIPTGKVVQPPCEVPLRTYQVVLKDEDVFADLKRNAAGEP